MCLANAGSDIRLGERAAAEEDRTGSELREGRSRRVAGALAMCEVGLWLAPMMGMGLFSGSMMTAMGSLIGHMVYGVVLATI